MKNKKKTYVNMEWSISWIKLPLPTSLIFLFPAWQRAFITHAFPSLPRLEINNKTNKKKKHSTNNIKHKIFLNLIKININFTFEIHFYLKLYYSLSISILTQIDIQTSTHTLYATEYLFHISRFNEFATCPWAIYQKL